ncbi:DNA-directed RNA polymerase III subunit RPC1 [Cyclospora cayetanensis]|nr:DNA-directed RNA polymerase III subunit RPC1 [Cyclospora cayetanensis]
MTSTPHPFGVLDLRLGPNRSDAACQTCGRSILQCAGHWGHARLEVPVFHCGYFKYILQILYCLCKRCGTLLLSPEAKARTLMRMRRFKDDPIMKRVLFRRTVEACKKTTRCPECEAPQGVLKRIVRPLLDQFLKIRHVVKNKEGRAMVTEEDLHPLFVQNLLRRMRPSDCEVLDIVAPEKMLIQHLLIPPNCIRPSVTIGEQGSNEDDLTCVLADIMELNNVLRSHAASGFHTTQFLGLWEFLQLQCTRLINSEAPAVSQLLASKNITKAGRGICQRLKGKEGRFRGNLSGKRVDFSGRTVISPDPNVDVFEVVVPEWVAKRLTFPEKVCAASLPRLRAAVLRGCDEWPGASYVNKADGAKCSLRYANRRLVAENLQIGDTVERHLHNGDVVLFNRQPSLHRVSIMAHRARVMPWRTFRFNECVCSPYNADFDGDEMNLHLPQTQEARAEALHLMGVVRNLVTPKNGEPLIAATQDFLSGCYLLTHKDTFFSRAAFCQVCSSFTDGVVRVDLPPPAILYPEELWTGKQVINVLLRPNRSCRVMLNFEVKEREFSPQAVPHGAPPFMCPRDAYVVFRQSELLAGCIGKKVLGDAKHGLFFHLIRDNSESLAAACMGRVARLCARWFASYGFTIGIDDVTPGPELVAAKQNLLEEGYKQVDEEIKLFRRGAMQPHPGCTLEQTLEVRVKRILDDLRNEAGKVCNQMLKPLNKPVVMFQSGAKGALINIAQMIACVGQQNVSGQRITNGFVSRTLPHFPMDCKDAKSRGFVANSFYSGLDPDEFFFHTMSGREGLVDTAVKTAETGYMQRRLMKALEDLSIKYDHTVRTSDGQIVQFVYGDDGLNPIMMEDKNRPANFDKVFQHVSAMIKLPFLPNHVNAQALLSQDQPKAFNRGPPSQKCSRWAPSETDPDVVLPPSDPASVQTLLEMAEAADAEAAGEPSTCAEETTAAERELWGRLPETCRHKLGLWRRWRASQRQQQRPPKHQQDASCSDPLAQQAHNYLRAHLAVYEWLPREKRDLPLLPYEILCWTHFLVELMGEVISQQLFYHQGVALGEAETHQAGTEKVRVFKEELREWLTAKAQDVAKYRNNDGEKEALTSESFQATLSDWRQAGFGVQRRCWIMGHRNNADVDPSCPPGEVANVHVVAEGLVKATCAHFRLWKFNRHYWVTARHIFEFLRCSWRKYQRAISEPGEAVGAMGAQSIGEPGTQMTLKTFHFAGVASMNVTLGVPRIKEIINAALKIQTPIIEAPLLNNSDYNYAVLVKNRIEKTLLSECCSYIKETYTPEGAWLSIKLDAHTIRTLFLDISAEKVKDAILRHTMINKVRLTKNCVEVVNEWKLRVLPPGGDQIFFQLQALKAGLLEVVLSGYKDVKRGVIKHEEVKGPDGNVQHVYSLAVEGYGLRDVMGTPGVRAVNVTSNHVMEVAQILGIEAARQVIITEIRKCMDAYSMDIDCRHMTLLGDVMTFRGEVLGINRFGIQKMRASTLVLASFEETNEHLFEAAVHHRSDPVKGVSECIIMGKPMALGTGSFDILASQPAR